MAEEIEEESLIDSWEEFDENPDVLDKQLKKMALSPTHQSNPNQFRETVIVNEEEALRSNSFNSQEPKIMILRRPQPSLEQVPNGNIINKQKNPVKTLEQRQAEYAQARLRILGNAGSATAEENKGKTIHKSMEQDSESCIASFDNESSRTNCNVEDYNLPARTKPLAMVRPSSNVNVVRSPRGPCGESGFQTRTRSQENS